MRISLKSETMCFITIDKDDSFLDHACVFMIVHGCDVHVHKFSYVDDYQDRLKEYVYTDTGVVATLINIVSIV